MPKIALAIGHNFAKTTFLSPQDKGAAANGTAEAYVTKNLIDTIIARGIP